MVIHNTSAQNMSMSSMASSQQNRSMFLSPTSIGSLGSPTAGANAEIELHWDPDTIRQELQVATQILSQRCLKLSAKWAAEQLLGLPLGKSVPVPQSDLQESDPRVLYAKSLMELGEYMHAASVLSRPNNGMVTTMAGPLPELSSYGIFLRAYALFMAGERRKEEDYIELQR